MTESWGVYSLLPTSAGKEDAAEKERAPSKETTATKETVAPLIGATASIRSDASKMSTTSKVSPGSSVKRFVSTSSSLTGGQMSYMGHHIIRDEGSWQYVLMLPLIPPGKPVDKKWDEFIPMETVHDRVRAYFPRFVFQNLDGEFSYLELQTTFSLTEGADEEELDPDEAVLQDFARLPRIGRSSGTSKTRGSGSSQASDEEANIGVHPVGDVSDEPSEEQGMTRREFHMKIRKILVTLLAGPHMGMKLQASETVDRDELFLKIELPKGEPCSSGGGRWITGRSKRYNTLEQLADAMDLRMPLQAAAYPSNTPCPTEELDRRRHFTGHKHVPAVMPYNKTNRKVFAHFTELDLLRLCRMRVTQYLMLPELMKDEMILPDGFFAVHRWTQVKRFRAPPLAKESSSCAEGWCHWKSVFKFPGDEHVDEVRSYFGEDVGFFFHWLNFFTRFLILPAVGGFVLFLSRGLTLITAKFAAFEENLTIAFSVLMVLWSATFGELYRRHMQIPIEKWGMRNYKSMEVQLASFRRELVGSKRETLRRGLHWLLVILVLAYTIGLNYLITKMRFAILHDKHRSKFMEYIAMGGKVFMSLNIQLVDAAWSYISPKLTANENHRTKVEMQEARLSKLFIVKLFVYYWPFYYIAFAQQYVEGCEDSECLQFLEESLAVFMLLHFVFVVLYTIMPMLSAWSKISKELNETGSESYTYLQAQAKLPAEKNLDDDFLELIISLGLVMQFSAVMPVIPVLQYLSNMVELRLLAYQLLLVYRRSGAHGAEGIGLWESIIYYVSCLAVLVNVGLLVWFQAPMNTWNPASQLKAFVLLEHALFGVKFLVELAIPDTNLVTLLVQTTNETVKHKLFARTSGKPVNVKGPRHIPNMDLITEDGPDGLGPYSSGDDGGQTVAPVRDRKTTTLRVKNSSGKDTGMCVRSVSASVSQPIQKALGLL